MDRQRRIWIDIDNSPHVPFFVPIIEELQKRGYEVILTARDAYQVCELLEVYHLSCKVVGTHYGKNRVAKILGTCMRAAQLLPMMMHEKVDLGVSHGSRAQMMCGFALGIPTLLILDYEFIAMMGFIRPDWIFVPNVIPDSKELVPRRQVLRYPGLKEDVYIPRLQLNPSVKNRLGLDEDDLVVTVRPPATEAHYHNPEAEVLLDAVLDFLTQAPGVRVILLPRNENQTKILREAWRKWITNHKIVIPEHAVDGINLIWFSDLVVSGGGTMNREAAALGVPVYSIFRGKIGAVDRYLQQEGRLILIESVEDIREKIVLERRQKNYRKMCNESPALQAIVDGIGDITKSRSGWSGNPDNVGREILRTSRFARLAMGGRQNDAKPGMGRQAVAHGMEQNLPSCQRETELSPTNRHGGPVSVIKTTSGSRKNQALLDYYRCPETVANFLLAGKLSQECGYFRFGPDVICYGQSSSRVSRQIAGTELHDSFQDVSVEGTILRLPFDPARIADNLRCERYTTHTLLSNSKSAWQSLLRSAYYAMRPLLPVPVRKHIQRFNLKGSRETPFPKWPLDHTVEDLMERLLVVSLKAQGVQKIPFIWFWPHGSPSCTIVTHDVEELRGRDFCSKLMDLDDSMGIKAAFQIVPEERYPVPESFLNEIRHRKFEINIHDFNHDGDLFRNRELFLQRVQRINQYGKDYHAFGFRSGSLYRNQDWHDALEFSYDLSVPNAGHLEAQQGGCCTVMPFFAGRVLELPVTTTQDYSLFHILNDYSIDLWKRQMASIAEKHGLASFIVHPDYVIEKRAQETYTRLLEYLAQLRAEGKTWIALPGEVNSWWRDRSQMTLVDDNGTWRIQGPGKERARIAYAAIRDDKIVYTVAPSA